MGYGVPDRQTGEGEGIGSAMAVGTVADPAEPAIAVAPAARRPRIFLGWYLVGAAVLAQFVSAGIGAYVTGAFFVPMTSELGWTRAEFTLALTVGQFAMGIVGFMIGASIDRYGGRPLMLAGVTVMGLSLFLMSSVTELWHWIVLRGVLFTIGAALVGNLVVNVTLSKWFVEKRGRAIGFAAFGLSFGGVVLPPVMTSFVDAFGWRAGWQLLAVAAWALVYPTALVMRRQPEDVGLFPDGKSEAQMRAGAGEQAAWDFANSLTRRQALRTAALYQIVLAFGLASAAIVTMLTQAIPYMTDAGFSRSTASFVFSLLALPAAFSKPIWGYMSERIQARYLASVSFAFAALSMLAVVAAVRSGSPGLAAGAFFMLGASFGGMLPLQETIWAVYFGRRYLGEVRSAALPFAIVLSAGAPFLAAVYFDRVGNYDGAFVAAAALYGLSAWLVLLARRPQVPGQQGPGQQSPGGQGPGQEGPAQQRPGPQGGGAAAPPGGPPPVAEPATPSVVLAGNGAGASTDAGAVRPVRPRWPLRDYMNGGDMNGDDANGGAPVRGVPAADASEEASGGAVR